ncbi:MAG: DUF2156 domain-containing protein [Oscillospiraceae bacterium]|nr:DUF2156 domain-containing protein [Oscillospiraceae bacterium]
MIDFRRHRIQDKETYDATLFSQPERGCEYSFANQFLWGRQQLAWVHGCNVYFAHFYGRSVYPYPIGSGDKKAAIDSILHDAYMRGIPCRLTGMTASDREELLQWYGDRFTVKTDRDSFDYVYAIDDLADLRGRKYQKKRNHVNRFRTEHPNCQVVELNCCNLGQAQYMVNEWYRIRMKQDPEGDYLLENIAMARAFQNFHALGMEGIMLVEDGKVLAVTMGTKLTEDIFDVHFEKALEDVDGAYPVVNCEFSRYLRLKHPEIKFLNREDDMGLEGLRKAKLSYNPHHMVEKYWAYLTEEIHEL